MVKAIVDAYVVARAPDAAVISIEGSTYFPPESVVPGTLQPSATPYTCPWKGASQYYDVATEAGVRCDAAWSYPEPHSSAIDRVGRDFARYVAFDPTLAAIRVLEPEEP